MAANTETERRSNVWNGWLVENEKEQWLRVTADGGDLEWTADPDTALCFSQEEGAFDFITLLPRLGVVLADGAKGATEHFWVDGDTSPVPQIDLAAAQNDETHPEDENAVVLNEHEAAEAYAVEHNEPIGG